MHLSRIKPSHHRVSASVKNALTERKCFVFDFYWIHCSAICNPHRAVYPRKDLTTLTIIYIEDLFYGRARWI